MHICNICTQPMVKKHADLTLSKTGQNNFMVKSVLHLACDTCGLKLIFPDEANRVIKTGLLSHINEISKKRNTINLLELKEELKCDLDLLEEMLIELIKKDIILIGGIDNFVISFINKPKQSIFKKLLNIFGKGA